MPDVIENLRTVFADERAALRDARFEALPSLEAAKLDLISQLAEAKPTKAMLASLKTDLMENQTLISSAIAGVAAARARLDALQAVRQGLSVYDQFGSLANVRTRNPEIEKKA